MALSITRPNGRVWRFDAVITANYDPPILITDNPIEDGSTVSDHAIVLPETWSVECVVSGSPDEVNSILSSVDGWPQSGRARHEACEDFLRACLGEHVLVIFRGRAERYFIQAMPYPVTQSIGVVFNITFKRVNIALQNTTTLPRLRPGRSTNKPKPNPNPSPNGDDVKNKGADANAKVSESFAETLRRGGVDAVKNRIGFIVKGK